MYATAHRAQTPEGHTGINSYLFLHFEDPLPLVRENEPDVEHIAQWAPGTYIDGEEDIRPGGNAIQCFLDVAGPDDAQEAAVHRVLEELRSQLRDRLPPIRATSEGLTSAFNAILALDNRTSLEGEFDELSSRVCSMLPRRSGAPRPTGPLVVWVRFRTEGIELSLPSVTRARLGRSVAYRMKALLPADVVQHFPGGGSEALLETAKALTQRSEEWLRRTGGLLFVDPTTEEEVSRWM